MGKRVGWMLDARFDLIVAIEVGLILSGFLFMKRMSESIEIQQKYLNTEDDKINNPFSGEVVYEESKVSLFEINEAIEWVNKQAAQW